jgi:hypothetical protein
LTPCIDSFSSFSSAIDLHQGHGAEIVYFISLTMQGACTAGLLSHFPNLFQHEVGHLAFIAVLLYGESSDRKKVPCGFAFGLVHTGKQDTKKLVY